MNTFQRSVKGHRCASVFIFTSMMLTFGVQSSSVYAQEVKIVSGAYFINTGRMVVVSNTKIVNAGTITNNSTGSIKLAGNWQNDGTYIGETGSALTLNGTSAQEIGGSNQTMFSNLTLNNNTGFTLSNNIIVNDLLDFQNGILTTGVNALTIGASGIITNANASNYVNGKLAFTFNTVGSKFYPIGKGGNYRPLTFQYANLSGSSVVLAEQFESALTGTLPAYTTLLTTNRYWTISQTGGSNLQYYVTLDPTDYIPSLQVVMLKQDAGTIVSYPTTTPNYTNSVALTSFSDFGLGETQALYNVTGVFNYNNTANTPLDSIWVILKQNSISIDSTRTNLSGSFTFAGRPDGIYTVSARTTKPWSGVNSTDAVKIQRHFTGFELLTEPVRLLAGDVNFSNFINTTDAVKVKRRFAGLDTSFARGNWTFSKPTTGGDTIIISSANPTQNFYGLCVGDVNASNIPGTGAKSSGLLALEQNAVIKAVPGDVIEIPVNVSRDIQIGAISMVIGYPEHLMQIKEVHVPQGMLFYTTGNGQLRLAWSETQPLMLARGDTMMTLVVQVSTQFTTSDRITLSLTNESEIADLHGIVFNDLILNAPVLIHKGTNGFNTPPVSETRFVVYPVPNDGIFTASITSSFTQTFDIMIYNKLGQLICEKKEITVSGTRDQQFDLRPLENGIYSVILRGRREVIAREILINH